MAPGVKVLAADTTRSQQYSLSNGTSDATAYVSAAAALVRSKYPDLSAGQVINRLIKSATFAHHKGLKAPDEEYGYGIVRPYSALTMDIPAGPKSNPLGQLKSSVSSQSSKGTDSTAAKKKKSSSGNLVLIGGIAAVVIIGVIAFVLIRSRRNGGNGGPGSGTGGAAGGYPSAQQYPNSAPNHGYPTAPGQSAQHPNPYSQQPPHQGQ